ncbi:La-related protein 6 [Hordeum vulgare]|nr:La-related protein 6 [Hordeum vulgare]
MDSPPYAGEVGDVRANPLIQEEHLATEAGEDVDYVAVSKASSMRALVFRYLRRDDYDIKLVNITGFTRAMSQVKWSTSNASSSTVVDLFKGPAADLLCLVVMDLRSFYVVDPLFSFLKETFYGSGLGSLAQNSDLMDQDKGTHYG